MSEHQSLPTRPLGKDGPQVPRLGLGLMNNSGMYNLAGSDESRFAFLDAAYDKGETFWDTADEYNDSEDLIGKYFAAKPEKRQGVFLATKFGIQHNSASPMGFAVDSSPEYCRKAIEKSLKRLGLPYVDLYYVHRLDKVTPVEKTVEALVELKKAGKIKYLGLSECSAETLRRAHAVHPITAVQLEYSAFCLTIESPHSELLETARELGVAVVAYSPLGNGILGGGIRTREDVSSEGDLRGMLPMVNEENLPKNVAVVDKISEIAKGKGVTTAQLSLAWLLAQGDDIFPIPGTTKVHRLEENLGSLFVDVSKEEEKAIRELSQGYVGGRFQTMTGFANGDTPLLS